MLYIDVMSRTPVYEQIIGQIEKLIGAGLLKEGEQLPSVRSLSLELSVNPNTIQKACGELDSKGIIGSVPGKGCFVMPGAKAVIEGLARNRLAELTAIAAELLSAGVTKEEIIEAVNKANLSCKEETK
ncbi:MAG: GntR family transcriptional regulator [Clostridia bacterium]|nr:GntR family transcriptional regulator [Clostridia bacterium]